MKDLIIYFYIFLLLPNLSKYKETICHLKMYRLIIDLYIVSKIWLPVMDSNHDKQLQRLLSYH